MLKYSAKHTSMPGIVPGMVVGIAIGLLLTGSGVSRSGGSSSTFPESPSVIDRGRVEEIAWFSKLAPLRLCDPAIAEERALASGENAKQRSPGGEETTILNGIKNTRRLLPLVKTLSIKALVELSKQTSLPVQDLSREQRRINHVDRVILDGTLGCVAAVQDSRPREIRIGSEYAESLVSDDEAVFLLAHELTHVAAETGGLDGFIENISRTANIAADIEICDDQREDLVCDYIGSQVLKQYIDLYPTSESKAERLLHTCGYESPSERMARALEDFCTSYNGFAGDTHHLSQDLTIRALSGLDPELKTLINALPATNRH